MHAGTLIITLIVYIGLFVYTDFKYDHSRIKWFRDFHYLFTLVLLCCLSACDEFITLFYD